MLIILGLSILFGILFVISQQIRPLFYLTLGLTAIVSTVLIWTYMNREEKILMPGTDRDIINANIAILLNKGYTKGQAIQIARAYAKKKPKVLKK